MQTNLNKQTETQTGAMQGKSAQQPVVSVMARLDIEVFVDCPHCEYLIDLLKQEDTGGHYHNEEGHVLSQACPDGHWIEHHKSFHVNDVTCSECGKSFNVKGLEW